MRTPARTLCASAALIVAATVAAPAAIATGATTAPETFLVLGVQSRSGGQFVTVRCGPVSGTHPHPEAVCKALGASGGDINKVIGQPDTLCPTIYDPVTATASGSYQGTQVIFRRTYSNPCDLASKTAPVFEFR
jgi:hypothetical protein